MQYLYSGGCNSLDVVAPGDVLELMAAASFFQLDGLLRYTEARCSQMIDIDNVVAMYIHAKVCILIEVNIHCKCTYHNSPLSVDRMICRCTVHRSSWNTARNFYCKIWSHCSRTMIRWNDCYSQRKFQIMMYSMDYWRHYKHASNCVDHFKIRPIWRGRPQWLLIKLLNSPSRTI